MATITPLRDIWTVGDALRLGGIEWTLARIRPGVAPGTCIYDLERAGDTIAVVVELVAGEAREG